MTYTGRVAIQGALLTSSTSSEILKQFATIRIGTSAFASVTVSSDERLAAFWWFSANDSPMVLVRVDVVFLSSDRPLVEVRSDLVRLVT